MWLPSQFPLNIPPWQPWGSWELMGSRAATLTQGRAAPSYRLRAALVSGQHMGLEGVLWAQDHVRKAGWNPQRQHNLSACKMSQTSFCEQGVMMSQGISCRPGVGCPGKPNIGQSVSQRCLMLRPALPAGLAEDRSRRQQDVLSQQELQCCAPARGGTRTKESAPSLSLQQIFSLLHSKLQHFFVI